MIDMQAEKTLDCVSLDAVARYILGDATSGCSTTDHHARIHLLDESQSNQDTASAILNYFGDLIVSSDISLMTEGDPDPIITCSDPAILSDTEVGYVVLLDGLEYAAGTDTISAGVVSLTLANPVAGVYEVIVYRLWENYASGSVVITVNENG